MAIFDGHTAFRRPGLFRLAAAFAVLLLGAAALTAMSGAVRAATIGPASNAVYNCVAEISGVIEKGDAERLRAVLEALPAPGGFGEIVSRRICLDSPGGSFAEAIRMANVVYSKFGTAVPRGATCESACSVVFLAGSMSPEDDRGVIADRIMHPTARLGFHAPSLVVPEGQYDQIAVNKAYTVAVGGIGQLIGVSGFIKLPVTLISAMLETPPNQMMHVETVGQAARWQIAVAPTVAPDKLSDLAVINACNNWYQFQTDTISANGFFEPNKSFISAMELPKIERQDGEFRATLPGFGQEAAYECNVSMAASQETKGAAYDIGFVSIGDEVGTELFPYMLFSRDTAIQTLARADDATPETVAFEERNSPWVDSSRGECFVFAGSSMADHDPCVLIASRKVTGKAFKLTKSFVWPSGGKTVVVEEGAFPGDYAEKNTINGVATEVEFGEETSSGEPVAEVAKTLCDAAKVKPGYRCDFLCWPNKETGKRFCFLDYGMYDTALEKWDPAKVD